MERRTRDAELVFLPLLLAALLACGGAAQASFECAERTPVVPPQQVRVHSTLPEDEQILGSVAASCAANDGRLPRHGEECSIESLEAALLERAAAAGGTGLVGFTCDRDPDNPGRRRPSCRADVSAPKKRPTPTTIVVAASAFPACGASASDAGAPSAVPAVGAPSAVPAVGAPSAVPPAGAPNAISPVGAPSAVPPAGAPRATSPVGAPNAVSPVGAPSAVSPVGGRSFHDRLEPPR